MSERFLRTQMLLGGDVMEKLRHAHVAVFGLGGVGGHVAEALARCGIEHFDLFDCDVVSESNINRQLVALGSTVGRLKTEVAAERMKDINPSVSVNCRNVFYLPENADEFPLSEYSYVVDCIDTVSAKIELAVRAQAENVPIISSMGTGNKIDPTALCISDIYSTSMCPLARVMRRELKARGVKQLTVVWSTEKAMKPILPELAEGERPVPGSTSFVPSVAGLFLASHVVRDISGLI